MAIEDLFKAMDMFKQGAQEYQQTQAINDARQQLGSLQSEQLQQGASEKAMQDYHVRQAAIGQDLALRLTSAHAAPLSIQAATTGLVPSASEIEQGRQNMAVQQAHMASTLPGSPAGLEATKSATSLQEKKMMMDAMLGKNQQKDINEMTKSFEKMPEVTPLLKAIPTLQDASNKMHENADQYGSTAITNLVKMGVIKASVQRVTENEIKMANESASGWEKLKKEVGIQMGGEAPKSVQDFWTKIVDQQLDNTKKALQTHIGTYSQSNPRVDPEVMKRNLLMRHNLSNSADSKVIQDMGAWLQDPANSQDPDFARTFKEYMKLKGQ